MSVLPIKEKYNNDIFLSANVGDWVDVEFEFLHRVDYFADDRQRTVIYRKLGGSFWFETTDGTDWANYGFVSGKQITIDYFEDGSPDDSVIATIDYVDGEKMFFATDPLPAPVPDGSQWPIYNNQGERTGYLIFTQNDPAESIEYDFNLTTPDSSGFGSVVDGSVNRFKANDVNSLVIAVPVSMVQVNNKSGGYFLNVQLQLLSVEPDGYRRYKITFLFFNWTMLQNGFSEPEWFAGVNTLAPIHGVNVFSELNNSNSSIFGKTENVNGSLGGFDENFNTGLQPYTLDNVIYKNSLGDVTVGIDIVILQGLRQ